MKVKAVTIVAILFAVLFWGKSADAAPLSTANVTVLNETKHTICKMYLTPSTSSDWTNEVLKGSQMKPWAKRSFTVSKGLYDIWVQDCAGNTIILRFLVDMSYNRFFTIFDESESLEPDNGGNSGDCVIPESGPWPPCATGGSSGGSPTQQPPPPTNKVTFIVENGTSNTTICGVHITKNVFDLGGNWLGNWPLKPGEQRSFQVESGIYYVHFKNCSGKIIYTHPNTDITKSSSLTLIDA